MLRIFRKTSWKIDGKAFEFFDSLFRQLPDEFRFLSDGLGKGLYKRYAVNFAMKGHHYFIGFDPSQSDKSIIKEKQFELENILVIQNADKFVLNITVYEGVWVGFEIEKNVIDFQNFKFDLSGLNKGTSKFAKNSQFEKLIQGLSSAILDLHDAGQFEIDGKIYYQIKDLEDANYIVINDKGEVFRLIHDPYKIELINKSVRQFVADVNTGKFDFEK
jgi:hypothetical protein